MTTEEMRKAFKNIFDMAIVRHGFTPFFRDYDIVVGFKQLQWLYRFSHCTSAVITTAVADQAWQKSWDDIDTDYSAWTAAGCPKGYVGGVCCEDLYPGATYVENSLPAEEWTRRLAKPMHEVRIETNGHNYNLIFHDLRVRELNNSDEDWVPDRVSVSD